MQVLVVTLRDVAKHAGVSFKTVSNVVNDFPYVSSKTRLRVRASIDELGYRPNQTARNLRMGTSGFLGLIVPDVVNPYFANLASLVGQAAKKVGWAVVVEETEGEAQGEQHAVDELSSRLVDGVLFSPIASPREFIEDRLGATPMLLLGERAEDLETDHVGIDNVLAGQALTEHLLAKGTQRIGVIGYNEDGRGTGGQRWLGHIQALESAGIMVDPTLVSHAKYDRSEGARITQKLLDRAPDLGAVMAMNDLLALGSMYALRRAEIRVPQDVVVAGFDNIEEGHFSNPSLTSVAPDLALLANEAVKTLLRRIDEPDSKPRRITIPFTINIRESTTR